MSQNSNGRALALLDRVARETGLTPDAKTALIQLINPFADFEMQKVGYFDTNESSSVIQCVRFSKTIAAPPTVLGNWDAHVFSTPFINTTNVDPVTVGGIQQAILADGALFFNNTANAYDAGGVVVMTGSPGAQLNFSGASQNLVPNPQLTCTSVGLCPTVNQNGAGGQGFLDGICRVIAMGFEVHNTTAAINLQGAVAGYRLPQPIWLDRTSVNLLGIAGGVLEAPTTVIYDGSPTLQAMNDVPGSLADVMLLNGTHQWEAKDGIMVVPTLNDVNIPVQRLSSVLPVAIGNPLTIDLTAITQAPPGPNLVTGFETAVLSGFGTSPYLVANSFPVTANKLALTEVNLQHVANFNTGGAFFTGLSNATTLVVNSIYYIERFPKPSDLNLVVLANPSPPYSAVAMTLYPEFMRSMPVACKVGDNADGDWFFEAVKSVSSFLTPALGAAGAFINPALGPAALALGSAASTWADQKLIERNPGQKQPRKVTQMNGRPKPMKRSQPQVQKRQQAGQTLARPAGYPKKLWSSLSREGKLLAIRQPPF